MFRRSTILCALSLALMAGACAPSNPTPSQPGSVAPAETRAPIIEALDYTPKAAVTKNDYLTFMLVAKDPAGKELQLNWTATRGRLTANTGSTVAWAPMKADGTLDTGVATITVVASNGKLTTTGSVNVQITDEGEATISEPPVITQQVVTNGVTQSVVVGTASGSGGSVVKTDGGSTGGGSTGGDSGTTTGGGTMPATGSGSDEGTTPVPVQKGTVVTLAGSGSHGELDGPAASAQFYTPRGIAVDSRGSLFVADHDNDVIRKIDPSLSPIDGKFVTTFAGKLAANDFNDGSATEAALDGPGFMTADTADNVYFVDHRNNCVRKVAPNGTVSTLAGSRQRSSSVDGSNFKAGFSLYSYPADNSSSGDSYSATLAVDSSGNVYVAESNKIRRIDIAGNVTTLAGGASVRNSDDTYTLKDGVGPAVAFNFITSIALQGNKLLIVDHIKDAEIRDRYNVDVTSKVVLRQLDLTSGAVTTLPELQMEWRSGAQTKKMPFVDYNTLMLRQSDGTLVFASRYHGWLRKLAPGSNQVTLIAGIDGSSSDDKDGSVELARFGPVKGITVNKKGQIIFSTGQKIKMYTP